MAAYDVSLVQFNGVIDGLVRGSATFPGGSHPYFLHSAWYCLPNPISIATGSDLQFGLISGHQSFVITVSNIFGTPPSCQVILSDSTSSFYEATFALPANIRWNVIASIDCINQIVQVYCNDAPCALLTGGFTRAGLIFVSPIAQITELDIGSDFGTIFPAVADIWEWIPPAFVDLTSTANRRKFINADLSPVFLGVDGSGPFGVSPPIYLRAPSVATDIATNFGAGGPFTINLIQESGDHRPPVAFQPPTCPVPFIPQPPPPPPPRCAPWAV